MIATFTLHATGQKVSAELKEIERKYLIHFRRPDNYEGEFGFDWMRDNYKEICNDYEALKKEYYDAEKKEKVEIEGQEYFVPWLSMFPNQKGVKLNLEVEKIDDYQVRDDDYIELPAKAGVSFNPDVFKVSEIDKNTLVEVICETPLISDTTIEVLSKNNRRIVGKLNMAKNDVVYKLPIQFVKVFTDRGNETDNGRVAKTLTPLKIKEVQEDVQIFLNQAFIHLDFLPIKEVIINIDEFKEKKLLTFIEEGNEISIVRVLKDFDKEIYNKYFKGFKGVIVILSAIHKPDMTEGHARPFPLGTHFLFITPFSIDNPLTITHEIGHTLGLYHSSENNMSSQNEIQEKIEKYEESSVTHIRYRGIKYTRREYLQIKRKELEDTKFISPKFIFSKNQTDNIMEDSNAGYRQLSFWRWQCLKMQELLKNYYK